MECLTLAGASGAKGLDQPEMKEKKTGRMLPVAMHPHLPSPHTLSTPLLSLYTLILPGLVALGIPAPGLGAGAPHPAPPPPPRRELSRCGRTGGQNRGGESRRPPEAKGMSLRARPKAPRPWLRQERPERSEASSANAAPLPGAPTAAIPSAPKAPRPPGARAAAGNSDLCWNLV